MMANDDSADKPKNGGGGPKVTRRGFLKGAAGVAAQAGMPPITLRMEGQAFADLVSAIVSESAVLTNNLYVSFYDTEELLEKAKRISDRLPSNATSVRINNEITGLKRQATMGVRSAIDRAAALDKLELSFRNELESAGIDFGQDLETIERLFADDTKLYQSIKRAVDRAHKSLKIVRPILEDYEGARLKLIDTTQSSLSSHDGIRGSFHERFVELYRKTGIEFSADELGNLGFDSSDIEVIEWEYRTTTPTFDLEQELEKARIREGSFGEDRGDSYFGDADPDEHCHGGSRVCRSGGSRDADGAVQPFDGEPPDSRRSCRALRRC